MTRRLESPRVMLGIQALSIWPIWLWLARRLGHPEHAACMVAAASGLIFLLLHTKKSGPAEGNRPYIVFTSIGLMLLYVVLLTFTPTFIAAFPAILCTVMLAAATRGPLTRTPPAIWGLALLLLPTVPVLQEVVGYPLRIVASHIGALMLNLTGSPVQVHGVALVLGKSTVLVDAACSGVRMLWSMGFVCFLVGGLRGLKLPALLAASALALVLVVLANAMRVASLFYLETDILPGFAALPHAGVGIVVFTLAIVGQIGGIEWLASRQQR